MFRTVSGYLVVNGDTYVHQILAESALNRTLNDASAFALMPFGPNRFDCIVIAARDGSYRSLLSRRAKAFTATGHANFRKCTYCKQWDNPTNMIVKDRGKSSMSYHIKCSRQDAIERQRRYRAERRERYGKQQKRYPGHRTKGALFRQGRTR